MTERSQVQVLEIVYCVNKQSKVVFNTPKRQDPFLNPVYVGALVHSASLFLVVLVVFCFWYRIKALFVVIFLELQSNEDFLTRILLILLVFYSSPEFMDSYYSQMFGEVIFY